MFPRQLAVAASLMAISATNMQSQSISRWKGTAVQSIDRHLVSSYRRETKLFLVYYPVCFVNRDAVCDTVLPQTEDSGVVRPTIDTLVSSLARQGYKVTTDSLIFTTWTKEQKKVEGDTTGLTIAVIAFSPIRTLGQESSIQLVELKNTPECASCAYLSVVKFTWTKPGVYRSLAAHLRHIGKNLVTRKPQLALGLLQAD